MRAASPSNGGGVVTMAEYTLPTKQTLLLQRLSVLTRFDMLLLRRQKVELLAGRAASPSSGMNVNATMGYTLPLDRAQQQRMTSNPSRTLL